MPDQTDEEIAATMEFAEDLIEQIDEIVADAGEDYVGIMFSLFIETTRRLAVCGWEIEELKQEICNHAADALATIDDLVNVETVGGLQ